MAHNKQKHSNLWIPESTHEKIDSQKIFIENLKQHETNYTDLIKRLHTKVDSISELKALDVSSPDTSITSGTVVLVDGLGLYYYTLTSTSEADSEGVIKPNIGDGVWLLAGGGSGGGSLVVDDADYGEDTDADQDGLVLKIKKLFNKKLNTNFFPITTTKAVRDTASGKSLSELLGIIPTMEDASESTGDISNRDADTLGGISADQYALRSDYNGIICVLLTDNWVAIDGIYKYTVAMPSLTGNEFFDISLYDDGTATSEQVDTFNELITRFDVNAGEIIVYASEKPDTTISIILRGMCKVDNAIVANLSDVMEKYDGVNNKLSNYGIILVNSDSISQNKPWLVLQSKIRDLPTGKYISGIIVVGSAHVFNGYVTDDYTHATFLIHSYAVDNSIYQLVEIGGVWSLYELSSTVVTI